MDSNTGGILGIFAFLTSAAGLIYTAINHKRIRCRCCGRDLDMSVDVDPTDKPKPKPSQTLSETASAIEILPRNVEKEVTESEEEESPKVVLPPRRPNRLPKIAPY
jgi:EAL domain-containing protein (putative c-di-GMP-specific phosphodiesterase class I)